MLNSSTSQQWWYTIVFHANKHLEPAESSRTGNGSGNAILLFTSLAFSRAITKKVTSCIRYEFAIIHLYRSTVDLWARECIKFTSQPASQPSSQYDTFTFIVNCKAVCRRAIWFRCCNSSGWIMMVVSTGVLYLLLLLLFVVDASVRVMACAWNGNSKQNESERNRGERARKTLRLSPAIFIRVYLCCLCWFGRCVV